MYDVAMNNTDVWLLNFVTHSL